MTTQFGHRLLSSFRFFPRFTGVAVPLVGCLVLVGWMRDSTILKSVFPGLPTMKPATAILFILAGASLCLWGPERPGRGRRRAAQLCALLTASGGLLPLIENLSGWNLGLDRVLSHETSAAGTLAHGSMSPATGLTFFLVGCALSVQDVETRRGYRPAQYLILAASFVPVSALLVYAFRVLSEGRAIAPYGSLALHTAATFLLLCAGALQASHERLRAPFGAGDATSGAVGVWSYRKLPGLIVALAVMTLVVGNVVFYDMESRFVGSAGERLAQGAAEIAGKVDRVLFEGYRDIQVFSQAAVLQGRDAAAVAAYLDQIKQSYPTYAWIGATDTRGLILAATGSPKAGEPVAPALFRSVREEGHVQALDVSKSDVCGGDLAVVFAAPIRGSRGEFLGALLACLSVPALAEDVVVLTVRSFEGLRGEASGLEWQIINRDGDVLVDSRLRQEGRVNLRLLGLPSALFTGSAQPGYIEETHLRRRVPVLTGYAQAEGEGSFAGFHWGVLVRMDKSAILTPVHATVWRLIAAGAFVVVPLWGSLVWASGRLRREWAQALEDSGRAMAAERKLRGLLEAAPTGFMVCADGRIVLVNGQAEKIFGYDRADLIGQSVEMLVPERLRETHAGHRFRYEPAPIPRLMGQGRRGVDCIGRRKDGTEVPLEIGLSPVGTEDEAGIIVSVNDLSERKRVEEMVRRSEASLSEAQRIAHLGNWNWNIATNELQWSDEIYRIFGLAPHEFTATYEAFLEAVHPDDRHVVRKSVDDALYRKAPYNIDHRILIPDGTERVVHEQAEVMYDDAGVPIRMTGTVQDITERKRMETALLESQEQLRQSQKMEAVGRLAGGIAHDFNNLLTVITGYSHVLLSRLDPSEPMRMDVEQIKEAGDKAALLTGQLLAFSRRQVMQPKVLNLGAVVANLEKMLRRVIGEDIALRTVLEPKLGFVRADPGQVDQVLMNLAVNARDAMPQGGTLTIETSNVVLDATHARNLVGLRPGPHVALTVSDTGCGMDEETQARIFEPFFTTKEKGKGTGLGLSTVYGIVKQSDGHIQVDSAHGKGTAFRIYLPRVGKADDAEQAVAEGAAPARVLGGSETLLLVEDEEKVRRLASAVLREQGYTVLEAGLGREALEIVKRHAGPIHLLVTDVVMPEMSGRELAECVHRVRLDVKLLFVSGYTDDAVIHHGVSYEGTAFLQKPFTPSDLARKVREVLDASS